MTRTSRIAILMGVVLIAGFQPPTVRAASPIAVDDHLSVPVSAPATTLDVLANDTGTLVAIQSTTDPAHGTVLIAGDDLTLTYEPDPAFHGTDTFEYTLSDGAASDTASVTVDVNSPPVAISDPSNDCSPQVNWGGSYPVPEDYIGPAAPTDQQILMGNCGILRNDTDPDGDTLTYVLADPQPAHGTAFQYIGDIVGYRADPNYSTRAGIESGGQWVSDSLTYRAFDGYAYSAPATMNFWIAPINDAPTFTPGGTVTVRENSGAYSGTWATNVSPGPFEAYQTVHFELDPFSVEGHGVGPLFVNPPAIDSTGNLTFSIRPDTYGVAHLTFRAKDDGGLENYGLPVPVPHPQPDDTSDDVTFDIVVEQSLVAAAAPDSFTVGVDASATSFDVLSNDIGTALAITAVTDPPHGSLTNDGTAVTYTPDAAYHGMDSFDYTIDDTSTGTVTVTVNDPPVAVDDPGTACVSADSSGVRPFGGAFPIPEDFLLSGPYGEWFSFFGVCALVANDTDANGDALTYVIDSGPSHGSLFPDLEFFAYKPEANFSTPAGDWSSDSVTYRAFDGLSYSQPATIRFWIAPINDVPTFTPGGWVIVNENSGAYSGTWATNVSPGPNESSQTVQFLLDGPAQLTGHPGAALFAIPPAIDANGVLTFTVAPGMFGFAKATFVLKDDGGVDSFFNVLQPTPRPDDTTDQFVVDITVVQGPVDAVDDVEQLPEDPDTYPVSGPPYPNPWPIAVLENDFYGSGATITAVTQGTLGSVTLAADKLSLLYAPQHDVNGADTFTYTLDDGAGYSETATVHVTIDPTNDTPVAVADDLTVAEDAGATVVGVMTNDSDIDGDALAITGASVPSKGAVVISGDGTGLTYQPNANATGSDSFTYTVTDGFTIGGGVFATDTATVNVTITATNDAPIAIGDSFTLTEDAAASSVNVLANDTDVDGGTRTITAKTNGAKGLVALTSATTLTYKPNLNATGSDSFTYTISDGQGGSATGTVNITITPVNDSPTAALDTATLLEDAVATSINVLANDGDVDAEALTVAAKTNGAKGVVVLTSATSLTYKPNANATGADSFTYTISDGHGGSATGTVNVTITAVNDTPNAVNDSGLAVPESAGATALAVKTNDTDAEGDTLTITGKTDGAHGIVTITGGGIGLTYDPVQLFYGTDNFTYTVSDGHGGSDTATVLVTVLKDTTGPVAIGPAERFIGQTVGSTTTKARLTWSGTDTGGTGIKSYLLQVSVNGAAYATVPLPSVTATTTDRTLTDGVSYRYRVRATDLQGNVGAFAYGPTFTPARFQNSHASVIYSGAWTTVASASALGGSVRYASSTSARASLTRSVRDFAWVATRTPTSGSAQVWIDGVLAATINLRTTATSYRQLVFQRHFSTLGPHRIEIRPIGGGRIHLDAFLVYR